MATAQHDYYEVLGVPREADGKRIKDAFRELALKYHPDRNQSPGAEDRFKEVAEAYAVLSDPKKRAEYDARGFAGVAFGSVLRLGGGFFDRLFGPRRAGPARGRNLQVELALPLETILRGGEETVRYTRPLPCPRCGGSRP